MEMEQNTREKTGSTRMCDWVKALPCKIKVKALGIAKKTKKVGKDDPRRIIHSLKVGFALTLVSLFYYVRPLYNVFGESSMWAIFTVVVVFEFSVGATLSKSINRGFATMLAGALGVGVQELASLLGDKGKPIVLGFFVFLLAATSAFARFFPHIKARYDYGVLVFILTFSLVSISGYRAEKIIELALQRLSTILLGGAMCIVISIFVCPVWAGQDLHNLVASNLEKIANFLEGFGGEYFEVSGDEDSGTVPKKDKSFLQAYKSVLNTKTYEESLANFAWWEPCHGSFQFRHPWKQYLKIGALTRKCAYQMDTLSANINSNVQTPPEFKRKIQNSCMKMSSESSKALKTLAMAIKTVTNPSSSSIHIENSKVAIDELKTAMDDALRERFDLLKIVPAITMASILMDIIKSIEEISESIHELSHQACFKDVEKNVSPDKLPQLLHRGIVKPVSDSNGGGDGGDHVIIQVHEKSLDSPENGNPRASKTSSRDDVL
ncbi:Aluminum-activated malate transporter like [Actinidia chinensis var. chinensis]|uniref:Aluminum-activated malate transporter like n=1 Tax=Actinidia chinensis var. chinensis TaxID=1590841 RepID=A0A2R6QVT0_ACTCC|nr:Aluminum-activated malate transporter like [Actinidia chinensis var. chinensis]